MDHMSQPRALLEMQGPGLMRGPGPGCVSGLSIRNALRCALVSPAPCFRSARALPEPGATSWGESVGASHCTGTERHSHGRRPVASGPLAPTPGRSAEQLQSMCTSLAKLLCPSAKRSCIPRRPWGRATRLCQVRWGRRGSGAEAPAVRLAWPSVHLGIAGHAVTRSCSLTSIGPAGTPPRAQAEASVVVLSRPAPAG